MNVTPPWHMCLDRLFSQRIHSFWLFFVSQWLSKSAGAHTISTQIARRLTCFLFISCPCWIYSYCPYTQPTWGRILGQSPLCWISLCGTCIPCFARLPGTSFIVYSCCLELFVFFFCLFVLHVKSNSFCLERVLSCCWLGKVEHIARRQSCSAQCFELAKFFSKVWIFKGRKRSFWDI